MTRLSGNLDPAYIQREGAAVDHLSEAATLKAAPADITEPLLSAYGKSGASMDEMLSLSVRDVAEHIEIGSMKAEAYAARLLKQYAAHKDLNTVIFIDENRVLADARAIDQTRAKGDKLAPLTGVPVGVKDQADVAGYPTTAGNIALKDYIAKKSAWVVQQVVNNGAVVFAKLNCAAMIGQVLPRLNGATSSNPYFGFVRNPYDLTRIPGGSSGGSGAAVAARIVPVAIGEDCKSLNFI
ncbi:Amidase [Mesorhizobium albiziae]|uniref:Amidase n=2 Tax=Neomesorhizobium albiziae TaxID=335020 RepID=A0A1I4FRJ7_9HYPH|nr:Amidase [Mesorhizobium albiziae]